MKIYFVHSSPLQIISRMEFDGKSLQHAKISEKLTRSANTLVERPTSPTALFQLKLKTNQSYITQQSKDHYVTILDPPVLGLHIFF